MIDFIFEGEKRMSELNKSRTEDSPKPIDQNIVYIGTKPPMNYVLAALSQLNQESNQLIFKARGRAISRAVDVVEITRRRFMMDKLAVKNIKIGTERVGAGEDTRNVSTIEITVERTD